MLEQKETRKIYRCNVWNTWDDWTLVPASSPALAAIAYHEWLAEEYKHYKTIYVYEEYESPMVDKPKVFYL